MKNKKQIIIIIFLIVSFFGIGRIVKNRAEKERARRQAEKEESIEKIYDTFRKEYKSAYLFCMEGEDKKAREKMNHSLLLWKDIMSKFSTTTPSFLKNNINWQDEKGTVLEHVEAAYEFAALGKCKQVLEQTKDINQKISVLSKSKDIIPISPQLIDFGEHVNALALAKNKDDAQKDFIALKISFLNIKELSKKPEYVQKIAGIEEIIAEMDESNARKWKRARDKLVLLNKDLFLEFD